MEKGTEDYGKLLAKVFIGSDIHLKCGNYAQHNDFKSESLHYFRKNGETAKQLGATHIIYPGDMSYGLFKDLDYRLSVEKELAEQAEYAHGNLWITKGNHDRGSYGMTEYEFYAERGMFRTSEILNIGPVQFVMVDNGNEYNTQINTANSKFTYVIGHNWFGFKDMNLPGEHIDLDSMYQWYGIDGIFSGHIHLESLNKGYMSSGDPANPNAKEVFIWQLPCLARPQFVKGIDEDVSGVALVEIYERNVKVIRVEVPLLPLEESFNMALIAQQREMAEIADSRVDFASLMQNMRSELANSAVNINDILTNLTNYTQSSGNPEDIIMGMTETDRAVRLKAVELMKLANNGR